MVRNPEPRMLVLICNPKLGKAAKDMFEKGHVPLKHEVRAMGTATSSMADMLGLGGTSKSIYISMLPKVFANEMLLKLSQELKLNKPDSGIAFTVAINGISDPAMKVMNHQAKERIIREMEKGDTTQSTHSMIMATVNQGFSEDVMEAAREAGAAGGTVFHARRMDGGEATRFWGISVQPEREIVLILTHAEKKLEIMKAIGQKCGMRSEAQGFVVSLPVDNVVGLT